MQDVEESIRKLFVKSFDMKPEEVTLEANLRNDLEMDSTEVVELVLALEREFDIKLGDDEITNKHHVGDVTKVVRDKLRQ